MYWNFFFLLGAVVWGERLKSAASALHCYIPNYQLLCSGCWAVVWQLLQQRSVRSRLSWARMASSSSNQAVIRAPLPTYLHNHTHTYKKRGHNSQTQVAVRFKSLWKYITERIPKALLYMFQYNLPFRKIDESKVWKLLPFFVFSSVKGIWGFFSLSLCSRFFFVFCFFPYLGHSKTSSSCRCRLVWGENNVDRIPSFPPTPPYKKRRKSKSIDISFFSVPSPLAVGSYLCRLRAS